MSHRVHCVQVEEPYSRLEMAMDLRGLSPQDLAKAVGVAPREVTRWQREGVPEAHLHAVSLRLGWPHRWFSLPPSAARLVVTGEPVPGISCRWCAADAPYLCDAPMPDGGTCDRPVCKKHAARVGNEQHRCPEHQSEGGR